MNNESKIFATRHAEPSAKDREPSEFMGLSVKGEEEARSEAKKEFSELIEKAESNSVIFLGPASEHIRTAATLLTIANELEEKFKNKDKEDVIVYIPEVMQKWQGMKMENRGISTMQKRGSSIELGTVKEMQDIIHKISEIIETNSDKKVVVALPLYLKEFSFWNHGWINKETFDFIDYAKEILINSEGLTEEEKYASFMREWLKTKGKRGKLEGPKPEDCVEAIDKGIKRYKNFAEKFSNSRPLIIAMAGHSWELDAYLVYKSTGELTPEAFNKVFGDRALHTGESATITVTPEKTTVSIRGRELTIDNNKDK